MRRILVLLAVLGIAALIVSHCSVQSYGPPKLQISGFDGPDLKTLVVVDHLVDLEKGRIALAFEIPDDANSGGLIADVLETYRWANAHYLPVKCGNLYSPEMCRIGITEIYIVERSEVPVVGGTAETYLLKVAMGLDQIQVDRLLAAPPPETQQELVAFHTQVDAETAGTGGYFRPITAPQIFAGFSPR